MLKVWNVSLISATFVLCLLGTFLVRSGVLQSIHAFGASTVGGPLLALIAVVGDRLDGADRLAGSTSCKPERRIDSLLSRESIFLVNNVLLVGLALVIFWGTFFPLISEFFTGEKHSLAAPWFDRYVTPIGVLLVLFTGIGPLLRLGAAQRRRPRGACCSGRAIAAARDDRRAAGGERRGTATSGRCSSSPSPPSRWSRWLGEFWRAGSTRHALTGERLPARPRHRGRAQPPPLRRLRRPRRDRAHADRDRRLLELPDQPRPAAAGRAVAPRSATTTVTYSKLTADPAERADRVRRPARRHARRQARRHARPGAQLLPDPGPDRRGRSAATSWASRPARSA